MHYILSETNYHSDNLYNACVHRVTKHDDLAINDSLPRALIN